MPPYLGQYIDGWPMELLVMVHMDILVLVQGELEVNVLVAHFSVPAMGSATGFPVPSWVGN